MSRQGARAYPCNRLSTVSGDKFAWASMAVAGWRRMPAIASWVLSQAASLPLMSEPALANIRLAWESKVAAPAVPDELSEGLMALALEPGRPVDLASGVSPVPVMLVLMTIVFYLRVVGCIILESQGSRETGESAEADLFLEIGMETTGAAKRGSLALVFVMAS